MPSEVASEIGLSGACMVWFPTLNNHPKWNNSLLEDGRLIEESNRIEKQRYDDKWDHRIVMARSCDELNRRLYRFVGVFRPVRDDGKSRCFERVATSVKTFKPRDANRL